MRIFVKWILQSLVPFHDHFFRSKALFFKALSWRSTNLCGWSDPTSSCLFSIQNLVPKKTPAPNHWTFQIQRYTVDPKRNWRWKTQQLGTPTHNHQTFPKKNGMAWKPFCIIVAISLMANINIVSASNHRSSSAASCGRKNYAGMASSYLCPTSFLWHDSGSNHFNRFMEENNSTWRFDLYLKKLILSFQILVHWRC